MYMTYLISGIMDYTLDKVSIKSLNQKISVWKIEDKILIPAFASFPIDIVAVVIRRKHGKENFKCNSTYKIEV